WRKTYIRQSPVSETVLGRCLPAISGKRISAIGGGLPKALQGSRIPAANLRQTHFATDDPPSGEARHAPFRAASALGSRSGAITAQPLLKPCLPEQCKTIRLQIVLRS